MAVLDPHLAGLVDEPRHDAGTLDAIAPEHAQLALEFGGDLGLHQLDIVVAHDDVDRVSRRCKARKVAQKRSVVLADLLQARDAGESAAGGRRALVVRSRRMRPRAGNHDRQVE